MKIGFDAKRAFQNKTGLGNYSRTLLHHLALYFPENEYVLFAPKTQTDFQHLTHSFPTISPVRKNPLWRSFQINRNIRKANLDLFHGLSNELPFGISKSCKASIVTIHDVIFDIVPEDFGYFDRQVFRLKTHKCVAEANKIIAISEATKSDLIHRFQVPEEKITVIYQPHDPIFQSKSLSADEKIALQKKYDLPSEFMLYVGSIMKRKNTLRMIQAWERLRDKIPLLIFGHGNFFKKEVVQYIEERNLSSLVQLRSPIAFDQLPGLYKLATCVIYPSLYEGFGLPVLEALACHAKVVTSEISSMPEAGGNHCIYVNPYDIDSISAGMETALTRDSLDISKLKEHLAVFQPEHLTMQVMNAYQNL